LPDTPDLEDAAGLLELHPDVDRARIRRVVSEFAAALDEPDILSAAERMLAT